MKRKVTALLTALLLTLTLCVPTLAWTEYGAIYDETDALDSDELSDLGQYTLAQLTELVKSLAPFREVFLTQAGCTVSSHCGPGTLGVLFLRQE